MVYFDIAVPLYHVRGAIAIDGQFSKDPDLGGDGSMSMLAIIRYCAFPGIVCDSFAKSGSRVCTSRGCLAECVRTGHFFASTASSRVAGL